MNVKAFLVQAIDLDEKIQSHVAEREHYRNLAMRIGGSRLEEKVSHSSPVEAPYAKWVEEIVDKEREIDAEIGRLVKIQLSISAFIDNVDNPKWQRILRSRYVMGLSWAEIAKNMGCAINSIQRTHKKILECLAKKLENEMV